MGFDLEQLETLKRRLEEDLRQDLAAIERLQRHFAGGAAGNAGAAQPITMPTYSSPVVNAPDSQSMHAPAEVTPRPDELTGSLRKMFSQAR